MTRVALLHGRRPRTRGRWRTSYVLGPVEHRIEHSDNSAPEVIVLESEVYRLVEPAAEDGDIYIQAHAMVLRR